jgi:hypothetical protein
MPKYTVEVKRTFSTEVEVDAADEVAAFDLVSARDFELPPTEEWRGMKDWWFVVYDEDGDELLRED